MNTYTVLVDERRTYRLRVEAESPEAAKDKVWAMVEDGGWQPEDIGDCIDATVQDVSLGVSS